MTEELLVNAILKAVEMSPAVLVLMWVAWRSDLRSQECIEHLFKYLENEDEQ